MRTTLKESANRITRGRMFDEEVETPPGLLGETNKRVKDSESDDENGGESKNDPESAAQRTAGHNADMETRKASQQGKENDELPKSQRHYHHVLIKEISKVIKHLRSSPPRKYTFDEWAWYLKLIGEDESSAETHRRAKRKPRPDGEGLGAALGDGDVGVGKGREEGRDKEGRMEWSWVGNRSPLMGNKEEAEWVLERLTKTLERELEEMRREEVEAKGKGESGRMWTEKRNEEQRKGKGQTSDSSRTVTENKEKPHK